MKGTTKTLLLFMLLCIGSITAMGQTKKTINGSVKDSSGTGLPGVSVAVKGTKTGTLTDVNGNFKLDVNASAISLVFTSVGYKTLEVALGNDAFINVTLTTESAQLNDVVVTGFGESRSRRNLGYSVTQVGGDQIRQANPTNPIAALQGMVAGLQVTPGVGGPSATPKFLIRGNASLDPYKNQPLIVVDGVIMDQTTSAAPHGGIGADFGNILKDINPDDIESMSVLKGGAVTALYGSRAANGVILIKTKKGVAQNGLGVTLAQTVMVDHAYKAVDYQNEFGWGLYSDDWVRDANGNLSLNPSNYGTSYGPPMTGQIFTDITGKVRANNPMPDNTLALYSDGVTSNTNVALSGGNDVSSYRFSYSKLTSNGVTPNNNFGRNAFTLRATHKLGKVFSLDANMSYTNSSTLNPPKQGGDAPIYQIAYNGARNYDINYWSTHYIDSANGGRNNSDPTGITQSILFPLYENNTRQKENNFRGGLDLTGKILPWLTFSGNTSVNYYSQEQESKNRGGDVGFNNPNYSSFINNLLEVRYRAELNATKTIKDFVGSVSFGGEFTTSEVKSASYSTNGSILPDVYRLSNSRNAANVSEGKPNEKQLGSLYFQGSLSWRDYLTLNLYGRNDKNSTLVYNDGHGTYSYNYGGADVAFVFTDAFKNSMPKFLNFGKIRLSYASAGNGTGSYITNTGSYGAGGYTPYSGSQINTYGYSSNSLPNQNLVPERTGKIETGIEFRALNNRLGADITWYTQETKSQIIPFGVPSTSGVGSAILNGGKVRNRGLEVTLYGNPIQTKDFVWTSRFVYYNNKNTIVSLPFGTEYIGLGGEDGISTVAIAGGDYGQMVASYGFASYQAKDASGNNIASPLNGQRVLGMSANNTQAFYVRATNYGTTPQAKQPVVGSIMPKFLGSFRNTFTYKGFTLGTFVDAKFGGLVYSTTYFYGTQAGSIKSSLFGRTAEHGGLTYTPVTENSQYLGFPLGTGPREDGIALDGVFQQGSTAKGNDGQLHDVSGLTFQEAVDKGYTTPVNAADYYVKSYSWSAGIRQLGTYKNSWVSLREVTLGYDVPKSVARKVKLNNLRATLIGRNLIFLYNSAPNHINPDFSNDTGSGNAYEEGGVPYIRSYGFSLSTNF